MRKLSILLCLILMLKPLVFAADEGSLQIETNAYGNVFFENEIISFQVNLESPLPSNSSAELVYRVMREEEVCYQNTVEYEDAMTVTLPEIPVGVYTLWAEVYGQEEKIASKNVEFSYVKTGKNAGLDGIFGVCTHFAQNKGDVDISSGLLENSGVEWIRDECTWGNVEKQRGVYTIPAKTDDYVNKALSKGIKTFMLLDYGNSLYDEGGAPYTPAGRKAFANYAKAVAEHFKGRITTYEIWNEWSGGMGNPKNQSAAVYAELLKVVYPVLKSVDPNIRVIAGATHNEGTEWFREMLEAGAYDYFDGISYHPYCYPQNPDTKDYKGNIEDNYTINMNLLKKYGGEKPIWLTEFGWHTATGNGGVSEAQQAAYMARSYVSGMAYGVDKIFWYDFQDDGVNSSDREHNFGLVRCWQNTTTPYAAKPGYAALAAMTGMLSGAEFVKEYRPTPSIRVYQFYRRSDNKDVVVLYHALSGRLELSLSGSTALMESYDMFGNPCEVNSVSEEPVYLVGNRFNPQDIAATGRGGVSAVLGISNYFDGIRGRYEGVAASPDNVRNGWLMGGNSGIDRIGFDVDDTYLYENSGAVQMEITYYDYGNDSFYIEYDARNEENFAMTLPVVMGNTATWKTAVVNIPDANFANQRSGGDFRLVLTDVKQGKGVTFSGVRLLSSLSNRIAAARLSGFSRFDKMTIRCGDDASRLTYAEKGGRVGWLTDIDNNFRFLYCDIEDTYLYGKYPIEIKVDYFDEGEGSFALFYNTNKETKIIQLQDTKTWKTAVFNIADLDCRNTINNSADFRIALWTSKMGTSKDNICFGAVRVIRSDIEADFSLGFEPKTGRIVIDGYTDNSNEIVTVEILNIGKTEQDLLTVNKSNVRDTIIYANMVRTDEDGYFKCEFTQEALTGQYLVRVRPVKSQKPMTKLFNYFNCYEVMEVQFTDKNGEGVDTLQDLDYVGVSFDFMSRIYSMNGWLVLGVYDENHKLMGVNQKSFGVISGERKKIDLEVDLNAKLMSDSWRAKVFLMKGSDLMKPVIKPIILEKTYE